MSGGPTEIREDLCNSAITQAKAEIAHDVQTGVISGPLGSFGDLHDYVDANEYGGLTGQIFSPAEVNYIQEALDQWIKSGQFQ